MVGIQSAFFEDIASKDETRSVTTDRQAENFAAVCSRFAEGLWQSLPGHPRATILAARFQKFIQGGQQSLLRKKLELMDEERLNVCCYAACKCQQVSLLKHIAWQAQGCPTP